MILSERAQFELARRLRSEDRPTLGEVFTFLSGLYFRGKLAYANVFAQPAPRTSGVLVIASGVVFWRRASAATATRARAVAVLNRDTDGTQLTPFHVHRPSAETTPDE